jgi:mono/diheme cytochrome c family protein
MTSNWRMRAFLLCWCVAGAVAIATAAGRQAGTARKTVWDGIYSTAQAERGKDVYAQECSGCHGDFLDGDGASGRVVALAGMTFADNWEAASVNDLFEKIAKTMPRDVPGTLTGRQAADVTAFLLQYNEFPPGASELAQSPELALIDIVGKDGPRPLRAGSGVRAVGCLTAEAGDTWTLTRASAPVRTRNPAASTGADLDRALATPLGSRTIRLGNAKPGAGVAPGAKVEAKGVFATAGGEAITVMSLQAVAAACE